MVLVEKGKYGTDKVPLPLLAGAINPDIILGLINGQLVGTDIENIATVQKSDYLSIRFSVGRQIVELRYVDEVLSRNREIRIMQGVLDAIKWKAHLESSQRKFILAKQRKTDGTGTLKRRKNAPPKSTIWELEKRYKLKFRSKNPPNIIT